MAIQLYSDNLGFSNIGFCFGGSQDFDNACGFNDFSFDLQQQKQHQQQQPLQLPTYPQWQNMEQRNQNMGLVNSFSLQKNNGNNINRSLDFSQSIAATFEKQMQEIGRFITLQNERLRLALHEERKNQLATLVRKYETKAQILLKQKDEEIAKAVNRTMELEDFLRRMEIECLTWQRLAKENEAMVNSLTNTIQQIKETNKSLKANGIEDAGSCCVEPEENRGGHEQQSENEQQQRALMICKSCNSRNSCFIFLPCRHLCSCKDCETFLDSCPACGMLKNTSIEALV